MSADVLRRAAALMRERANGSLPGPWRWEMDEDSGEQYITASNGREVAVANEWSAGLHDGPHIASWHPAVALAVADWLDFEVRSYERGRAQYPHHDLGPDEHALTVARAYLAETEPTT